MYRGHRRGSGGPPGGATPLGGPHGPQGAGSQPLEGWARPPPWAHAPRVGGETLKGAPPLLGGQVPYPGRHPPSRSHLEGPAPLAPSPINRGMREGCNTQPRRSPSPPQHLSSSVRAWRSPVGVLLHQQHHAIVLPLELPSSTSPSSLLDQYGGDVVLNRTCVQRGGAVRSALDRVFRDLNRCEYDSIIRVP